MNSSSAQVSGGGVGFAGLLAIVFIVLKLLGVITWSWLWVLAPIWIPFVLVTVFLIIGFLLVMVGHSLTKNKSRKRYTRG